MVNNFLDAGNRTITLPVYPPAHLDRVITFGPSLLDKVLISTGMAQLQIISEKF
jgi:hypothetical protein